MKSTETLVSSNRLTSRWRFDAAFGVFASMSVLVLLVGMPRLGRAETTFTKITTGPIPSDVANGLGATWVDFDGDGDLDLYVSNGDGANLLYRNDGDGVFTPITNNITSVGAGSYSASWADFDNDGRIDLFIGRRPGPGLLFHQEADGSFTQSTLGSSAAFGAAWADYDKDGWLDLLVAYDSLNTKWHNDGLGSLSAVPSSPINLAGDAITWADYDGDGDMDLLITESSFSGGGNSRLYRNDGTGAFVAVTAGQLASRSTVVSSAAWGDYDNDGFPDLFLARGDFGISGMSFPSYLFHNNRDGTFTQVEQSPFTTDTGLAASCSWGDYDNDGWLDLFVTENNGSDPSRLYHNNGDGTFSRVMTDPIGSDIGNRGGCSWGDYDGDGFLDLFVAGGGSNYLYHNDGNSNAWITIKCVGTRSNRSAIGAKVRVEATIGGKSFWQLREINTGDGWGGVPLVAHFGLGDATNVQTLRLEWPSGIVQEFKNVPAKQLLTVTEPALLQVTAVHGVSQITLQGGRNLQYDVQVSSDLMTWSRLTTFTITNLTGSAVITDTNFTASARFYRAISR